MAEDNDTGRAKGGKKRAEVLSPEERKAIAAKGAAARWGNKPEVLHSGNFMKDFGIDVDCYVLNDPTKTAVISQRGMGQAIGLSKRGDRLAVFAGSKTMEGYIGRELREKLDNPLVFQRKTAAADNEVGAVAHGYDATILIDLCNAIIAARNDGKLGSKRYDRMVAQAQAVLSASGKAGIKGLVYALAGFNPTAQHVIDAFKAYIQEEARKYEPEFPNELYFQWYRLYEIPVLERGKPWHFKHLTVKHVYYPLAKSNGKLFLLLKALKAKGGDRQKKLFQFLNEIGARALRMQLGRILEMCESSADRRDYEGKIVERFGGQRELDLMLPNPETQISPPA